MDRETENSPEEELKIEGQNQLQHELHKTINRYLHEAHFTYAEIIGILEVLKANCIREMIDYDS